MKCGGGAGEYRRLKDQVKAVGKLTTHGKLPSRAQSLLLTSLSGLSPPPARKPANYSARQPAPQVLALIPGTFLLWSPYLLSQDFQQWPPPLPEEPSPSKPNSFTTIPQPPRPPNFFSNPRLPKPADLLQTTPRCSDLFSCPGPPLAAPHPAVHGSSLVLREAGI